MYGTIAWLVLLGAAAALESVGRSTGSFVTPSALVGKLSRRLPGRIVVVILWAFVGWHLFARYTIPLH
jgi:hypothetical protein